MLQNHAHQKQEPRWVPFTSLETLWAQRNLFSFFFYYFFNAHYPHSSCWGKVTGGGDPTSPAAGGGPAKPGLFLAGRWPGGSRQGARGRVPRIPLPRGQGAPGKMQPRLGSTRHPGARSRGQPRAGVIKGGDMAWRASCGCGGLRWGQQTPNPCLHAHPPNAPSVSHRAGTCFTQGGP